MSVELDRQLQEYCRLIDEKQGSVSFDDVLERTGELQVVPGRTSQQLSSRRRWIPAMVVALGMLAVFIGIRLLQTEDPAPVDQPPTTISDPTSGVSNGWIAFSTQPGAAQISETDTDRGGDIYLVRPGEDPRLIVGRGESKITNVCPTFSSDGSKLAYGEQTDSDTTLVVLDIDPDGSVTESTRIDLGLGGSAPCPRWSLDGTRLAFLSDVSGSEEVVVRGLDGSTPDPGEGDPTVSELKATMPTANPLEGVMSAPSHDGTSVASLEEGDVISIANSDGSVRREQISSGCGGYGIAAWSPDGRYILVVSDSGGRDAVIYACSVGQPSEPRVTLDFFQVNGARSWPGFGDVSWQPILPDS